MLASLPEDQEGRKCLVKAIRSPGNVPGMDEVSKLAVTDPRIRRRLVDHLSWTYEWSSFIPLGERHPLPRCLRVAGNQWTAGEPV